MGHQKYMDKAPHGSRLKHVTYSGLVAGLFEALTRRLIGQYHCLITSVIATEITLILNYKNVKINNLDVIIFTFS
jgi:hypothetical protein